MPNDNTPIFSITGNGPLNGSLGSISAASCTSGSCSATVLFTPNPDFNGSDSFNFKVTDGSLESNVATVSISVPEVNDAVTANGDAAVTTENMTLNLTAATLTGNDSAGPANESAQIFSLINVSATADTHGSVTLANGVVSYSPDPGYSGPASFNYQVCDNGTTGGAADFLCAIGTVNVTVIALPDTQPPVISCNSDIIADFDPGVNGAVVNYTAPIGTDNRPGAVTMQTAGLPGGSTFPAGTTTNTFTVTDAAGNTASCSFKVTVALTSLIGLDSVSISGAAYADSFDSSIGYSASKGSLANVYSNGTITLANSGSVKGNVRSTRAGVVLSGAARVTGDATAGTLVSRSGSCECRRWHHK